MLDARQGFRSSWISALESDSFRVALFRLLAEGERELRRSNYEALLINAALPDGDGVDWLRNRRKSDPRTLFVVMTPARVKCGADDAIVDSLQSTELVARLHALLRRRLVTRPMTIEAGNVTLSDRTGAMHRHPLAGWAYEPIGALAAFACERLCQRPRGRHAAKQCGQTRRSRDPGILPCPAGASATAPCHQAEPHARLRSD
jgi:DNA-binding response OmpR family regulator